jgi:biotin carboxylase
MKKLAIVGANEFQSALIEKAKLLGYETHVFSWGGGEIGEKLADHFHQISITEKEDILAKCQEIGVDGVCSIASDLANVTVHWVARELGLMAHSLQCIESTTNKFKMRNTLALHNQPIPFYKLVTSVNELDEFNISFPVIVKPIDRSGSRGITKVANKSELQKAIFHSQEVSFTDKVLVEEFVDGREFSIESITEQGRHKVLQMTEKFTTGAPRYIETAHLAPARLTQEQYSKIETTIIASLTALSIKFGPSHSEVKLKENGDVIIIDWLTNGRRFYRFIFG